MASIAPKEEKPDAGTELIEKFEMAEDPSSLPAEVEEPVRQDPPSPPPAPKHPAYLTRLAKRAGLDDKEIAELSDEQVRDAITLAGDRTVEAERRQPAKDPETGRFVKQEPEPEFSLKDVGLDAERLKDFDPALTAALTDLTKPLYERIKQLESGMKEIGQRESDRTSRETFDALDQLFAENEAVFGKGKRTRMSKDSEELARRQAVIHQMGLMRQSNPDIGFEESFEVATKRLFGAPKAPEPEPEPVKDPHGFRNGSVLAPTNRNAGKEPKGVKLAEKNLEAKLKERGALVGSNESDELPG